MSLLKILKNLVTYKEPKDTEGFEFIEDENEYAGNEKQYETVQKKDKSEVEKNPGTKKTPLDIDEWNEIREKKADDKELFDADTIALNLTLNIEQMKKEFNIPKNLDAIIREFKVARNIDAFILYIEGMTDKNTINDFILRPLMDSDHFEHLKEGCINDYIIDNVLSINKVTKESKYEKIIQSVLSGMTALFIDGCRECLIIENQNYEKRAVEKPVAERAIRGSHEGFSESMRTNITLIRKIIKNKDLITEIIPADKTNKTNCALLYIEGIANPKIINEVKRRIKNLDIDFISASGMLEELISDHPMTLFTQILTTERPDRAASNIMNGKIILITDGSPYVSSLPTTFFESLQSPEDYFLKWQFATFLRYLRLFAVLVALLLPGLYTAVTLFHQEMIPTELLSSIVKSREDVPFPTVLEMVFMEISFELIREGGIRVPEVIGNTLGIVGALILGQAAIQAQLVSPMLIIIVAVVGISSFAIPSYTTAFEIRILRFAFIFLGALTGFYGILILLVIILGLACNLKSFGVQYFAPIAPKIKVSSGVISSLPVYKQKQRTDYANPLNKHRSGKVTEKWKKGKDDDSK